MATADDAVQGYIIAQHAADEAEILNLGVRADARRGGIGRALVEAMLARLRACGVSTVFLEVRDSNSVARHLYALLGFVEVGRRRRYYRRPTEDAVLLRVGV